MKHHAIDDFGTGGIAPALQRSESQDSWCSVTSSLYSETSDLGVDYFGETSVSAAPLGGIDQPSNSQSDWLNSIRDSDNRHQDYGTSSVPAYLIRLANGLAPPDLRQSMDQMSQGDIVFQNKSYLSTRGSELPLISPPVASYFPWQNESWSQITRSDGENGQSPDYLISLESYTLPGGEFQQRPALPDACMSHQGLMQRPRCPHYHGWCASNAVVLKATPPDPQPGMNSSTRRISNFDSLSSSGIRDQTAPNHLFCNNMPPRGVVSQIPGFIPDKTRYSLWDNHPLTSEMQDSFERNSINPMVSSLPRLSYQSQFAFGTNTSPHNGRTTFEGYELPSPSSHGTPMMTNGSPESIFDPTMQPPNGFAPGTFKFPQTSTEVLCSPQSTITDQTLPLLREPLSLNSQPNPTFANFSEPSSPIPTSQSNNTFMSGGKFCVSRNSYLLAI